MLNLGARRHAISRLGGISGTFSGIRWLRGIYENAPFTFFAAAAIRRLTTKMLAGSETENAFMKVDRLLERSPSIASQDAHSRSK